jgi:hypothetical protein
MFDTEDIHIESTTLYFIQPSLNVYLRNVFDLCFFIKSPPRPLDPYHKLLFNHKFGFDEYSKLKLIPHILRENGNNYVNLEKYRNMFLVDFGPNCSPTLCFV